MEGAMFDRNTIEGFAARVEKNLRFVSDQFEAGKDVHVVTQLVLSTLGLIIFPYEVMIREKVFPAYRMADLYSEGWPQFSVLRGTGFETLDELIKHLRDAVSHYQIEFKPVNERHLDRITITLGWPKGRPSSHRTEINGADFRDFVCSFSKRIQNLVG
jgi:hypothetical protein